MHLKANCPKEPKNGIGILVDQALLNLWIKTIKYCFNQ